MQLSAHVELYRAANNSNLFLSFANCPDGSFANATGFSPEEAKLKATMEAFERGVSTNPSLPVIRESAKKLAKKGIEYLDPGGFVPLTPEQRKRYKLKPFDFKEKIFWVQGEKKDKKPIFVPLDLACYGFNSRDRLYFGNSSGVAAHTDGEEARQLALLELIERDAIMDNWFRKETPIRISPFSMGDYVLSRTHYWFDRGRKLTVFSLPSPYGRVFLATISGESWPAFVCGAAAMYADVDEKDVARLCAVATIKKAISEAEGNFEAFSFEVKSRTPETCFTPEDHALLYCDPVYLYKLHFLLKESSSTHLSSLLGKMSTFEELVQLLDVVFVWLKNPDEEYKVVRALSPALIPISFGYDFAHYAHLSVGRAWTDEDKFPHYFP